MDIQVILREEVKKIKWQEEISFKTIAEDLLNMNYHAFINWLHGYKNLSIKKVLILQDFINNMKD